MTDKTNFSYLALFQPLGVLGNDKMVNAIADVAVHKGCEVIYRVVDAVVGDASLRIVVGAYFG